MSYTNLLYHIVYATKERAPFITSDLKSRLHGYLGGIVKGLGGVPIEINGMSEHVHLLVKIRPTIAVSNFLSKLKSSSSSWGKSETKGRFGWQAEYGAFTVSESQVDRVRQYIRDQEKHHQRMSFEEESEALLNSNGIQFEKQYLWR
jgi:REP element-mobilizing transposase RayT